MQCIKVRLVLTFTYIQFRVLGREHGFVTPITVKFIKANIELMLRLDFIINIISSVSFMITSIITCFTELTAHERVLDFQKVKCDTIASSIITSLFYFPFHLPPSHPPLSMSNVGWVTFSIFHTADQQTSKRRPDFLQEKHQILVKCSVLYFKLKSL